jgi:hypothetical protein
MQRKRRVEGEWGRGGWGGEDVDGGPGGAFQLFTGVPRDWNTQSPIKAIFGPALRESSKWA